MSANAPDVADVLKCAGSNASKSTEGLPFYRALMFAGARNIALLSAGTTRFTCPGSLCAATKRSAFGAEEQDLFPIARKLCKIQERFLSMNPGLFRELRNERQH